MTQPTFYAFDSAIARIRERTKLRVLVHERDVLLPDDPPELYVTTTQPWAQVSAAWADIIKREQLNDFTLENWRKLAIDPRDGALVRGAGGLAITPHAWDQLIAMLLQKVKPKPSGVNNVDGWHSPFARAVAFDDCLIRSKRVDSDEMYARGFRDPRSGLMALRAVVSGRHAFTLFDDLALMERLNKRLSADAPAYVYRSTDETHGFAHLKSGQDSKLVTTLHWRNSETGCASLGFTGGVSLRFLDSIIIRGQEARGVTVEEAQALMLDGERVDQRDVSLVDRTTRTARNHTAPRKDGKRTLSAAERAKIANERMDGDITKACAYAAEMRTRWDAALKEFVPGFTVVDGHLGLVAFEILLDAAEETRGFEGEDRGALFAVLKDEKRLDELPRGSAAHMAATFAVLASRAARAKDARRLQTLAGEWLMKGWKR